MSCHDSNLNPNTGYYKECMRNYAANLGSHATDGCGEFTSDDSTANGLMCAACGCHRNFHRRVEVLGFRGQSSMQETTVGSESERSGKKRVRTRFSCEQKEKMLRFAEKIGWRIQRKSNRRAEQEDDEIEQFCREVGVSRQVFKVWMHNHKNSPSSSSSLSH